MIKNNKFSLLLLLIVFLGNNYCFAQNISKQLNIGVSNIVHSKILNEDRTINVYFPEDYNSKDTIQYPVIYVLDGGMDEDFVHISGLVRFNTQPWVARFPRSIVVGIEGNTRRRDFTFAVSNTDFIEKEGFKKSSFPQFGGSEYYMDFIEHELQPFIKSSYKTNGKSTIIGESLAGLLCTDILLKRPHLFNNYIIISPSLWWGDALLLKGAAQLLSNNLKHEVKVYIGAPAKEEDVKMYEQSVSLFQTLSSHKNIEAVFDYLQEETHATVMHQAVYNAFKKLYPTTTHGK